MRLVLVAAMFAACTAKRPPKEDSLRAGLQLARTSITERLRGCNKLPLLTARGVRGKGARQLSTDGRDVELFEMEMLYGNRNFFVRARRERGKSWALQGSVTPDPCTDDALAITEADVDALNAQGLPWKAGLCPEMVGKTVADLGIAPGPLTGVPSEQISSVPRRSLGPTVLGGVVLPESYDATDRRAGDFPCKAFTPRAQGSCGTCTHFSTSSVFGARLCLNNGRTSNTNILMSPRQISDCASLPNSGCQFKGSGDFAQNMGWYATSPARGREEWCLPYQTVVDACDTEGCPGSRTFPATEVRDIRRDTGTMQAELLLHGPLVVSFSVHNSLFAYRSGVYTAPTVTNATDWVGGHAVMLVGWGVDDTTGIPYWKVQNSWGAGWGDRGMLRIRRGTNECSIESNRVMSFVPGPSLECPNSPCANGSITLADCSCKCVGPILGGALCDTVVNACQNGGKMNRWGTSCLCPTGMSGPLCQFGFRVAPSDTAGCSGTAYSVRIPYTINEALDHRSILGMYALTQESPWQPAAGVTARICSAPSPCPLFGIVNLSISSSLPPGRYRIMSSAAASNGGLYNFGGDKPPVAYYTSIAPTSCTPEALAQARSQNDPSVAIVAAETAESNTLAQGSLRLDAAIAPRAQLASQGKASLTFDGFPVGARDVWSGTPQRVCFYVPPYQNQEKKSKRFELHQQDIHQRHIATYEIFQARYPAIDFVANPGAVSPHAACFTAAIPAFHTTGPLYTISMLTSDGFEYVVSAPFNVKAMVMSHDKLIPFKGPTFVTFNLNWNLMIGTPMPFDTAQVRSSTGTNASPRVTLSSATSLRQSGTFQVRLNRLPTGPTQEPYWWYYYQGNSTNVTASGAISGIAWKGFNL